MRLFIAEKPSVATHIVNALNGDFRCYDDYFESATDIVSCWVACSAEINASKSPNETGTLDTARVTLHWPQCHSPEKEATLAHLLKRADINMIVHCAVRNDEGRSPVDALLNVVQNTAPVKRALIHNSSSPAVKKAIRAL